jgi:phosphoribosyl 1,2-cyclic phosphodiesterase
LMEAIERILPEPPHTPRETTASAQFFTPATRVKFWGVRGSIPVPGSGTVRYGGNTTCVEVRADGEIIILDAGSGIRPLGVALDKEFRDRPMKLTLLITHSHWDHIQGLPFFLPAYDRKNEVRILGYEGARAGLASILAGQMETPYFPINLSDMPGNIAIEELRELDFHLGKVRVQAKFLNHPGVCVGYRLFTSTGSMAFLPDNEPYEMLKMKQAERDGVDPENAREFATAERQKLVEFLRDADLLMLDSQYNDDEYEQHVGWGHGSLSSVVSLALDADVRKLSLFHHDPNHDDDQIDEMVERARTLVVESGKPLEIEAAREGAEVWLGTK